jgi:hypothetical protein
MLAALVMLKNALWCCLVIVACGGSSKLARRPTPSEITPEETAAYEKAKPVFEKWCAECHSKTGAKPDDHAIEHFDITTYPFGGEHAMQISGEVREVLGLSGEGPSMPPDKKGAVAGEELELVKQWADAFDAARKAAQAQTKP